MFDNNNIVRNRRRSNNKRNIYIDFIEFVEDLKEAITSKTRNIALRECIPPPAPLKIKIYDISAILWS